MFAVTEAANTELATDGISKYLASRDKMPEQPVGWGDQNKICKVSNACSGDNNKCSDS